MTDTVHRVQGLNNDVAPADWPAIGSDEVAWLATRVAALRGAGAIAWHSPRPMSAAAIVPTDDGAVFIKRHHHSVRTAATLSEEHHFIAHLAAASVPVVQVLAANDGATAIAHGPWTYELHAVPAGEDLYRDTPSWTPLTSLVHARQAGRMLARLHLAAAGYHAPQRGTHVLVARDELIRAADPLAELERQLPARPALADYLSTRPWRAQISDALLPWHAALGTRLAHEPRLWAHNDWHASNLLWHADGDVACVLDFGLASPTSALYDLATAIERNAIAWLQLERCHDAVHVDTALALLGGYAELCPLSAAQRALLADLLPLVHVDFALSEVEYYHGITGSPTNAALAYDGFLLGHARWFHTAPAQALLAALRSGG